MPRIHDGKREESDSTYQDTKLPNIADFLKIFPIFSSHLFLLAKALEFIFDLLLRHGIFLRSASQSSNTFTMSAISQGLPVTPAAIAGVTFRV